MNSTDSPPKVVSGAPEDEAGRARHRSISALFLVAVAAALLPVCVLSFVQAYGRVERDMEVARVRLVESVQATSSEELNVFRIAEHVLQTLAVQPDVRDAAPGCPLTLRNTLIGLPFFANIARIGADGTIRCSALATADYPSVAGEPWWRDRDPDKSFSVTTPIYGGVSKRRVIAGIVPAAAAGGAPDGAMAVAIDLGWLNQALKLRHLSDGAVVALLDANGAVIAASASPSLPTFARPATTEGTAVARATDAAGAQWSYATAPLVGDTIFVAFAMPDDQLFSTTLWQVGTDVALPIIAILLASLAIWLAAHRWVIRYISGMQGLAGEYAEGRFEARAPSLDRAPAEIAALGNALHTMADHARDRDRRLQDALAQKALLVREVHHRVKNNLQIVVSLLSLQAGRLTDPDARAPLEQARTRIGALALVHRLLLDMEEQSVVDMRYLIGELSANLRQAMGSRSRGIDLVNEIVELRLPTDTAIPLTLFVVEAVTNAFRHAFPTSARGRITIRLKADGRRATLSVEDNGTGFDPAAVAAGTGLRLLRAFSQQLAGTLTMTPAPGAAVIAVDFPLPEDAEGGA